jgi:hypothetical protein
LRIFARPEVLQGMISALRSRLIPEQNPVDSSREQAH